MGLTLYNASAGSGKTYTLAAAYISKLLTEEGRNLHRHILAVTFTNKATAEMKSRIMQWLWALSQEDRVDADFVLKMCEITPAMIEVYSIREADIEAGIIAPTAHKKIAQKASRVLGELVHDYNNFSVTTIDSFFQRVLADVAYELRLPSSYKLNLDTDAVMEEAVEELLTTLETEPKAYNWLKRYVAQKIEENKSWNIREVLQKFGKRIFDERYLMFGQAVKETMADEGMVEAYRKAMNAEMAKANARLVDTAHKVEQAFKAEGLEVALNGNLSQSLAAFCDSDTTKVWKKEDEKPIHANIIKSLSSAEPTISLKDKRKTTAGTDVLLDFLSDFPKLKESYWSAHLSQENLYPMRMMSILDRIVGEINDKHNQFMLSKVGPFLQQLSQATGEESSFVFQKTGTRYRHIMIDEFQDTSNLQWRNFQLLFVEVLANSNTALIVGDSKQSIYRFRNGDWRIMQGLATLENVAVENLDTNYRSEPVVVTFNNTFFKEVTEQLDRTIGGGERPLSTLYQEVEQKVRPDKALDSGCVELYILDKDGVDDDGGSEEATDGGEGISPYDEKLLSAMEERILSLCQEGVPFSKMAILVRRNVEASKIIAHFAKKPESTLRFVSSEAFKLTASVVVNTIIHALRYACSRKDQVSLAFLIQHLPSVTESEYIMALNNKSLEMLLPEAYQALLPHIDKMPLYEVIEQVMVTFSVEHHLQHVESERAYLYAFLDEVMRFLEVRAENVRGFLKYWDKAGSKKTIPMEANDAIQILTLHKSKGLEFHTVLMPYADWKITEDKPTDFYWINTNEAEGRHVDARKYKAIPWLPITQSKRLIDSVYAKQYQEEQLMQYVDNINALYVAFTRAKTNLLVWGGVNYTKSGDNATVNTIGRLLHEWVAQSRGQARDYAVSEDSMIITTEYAKDGKKRVPQSLSKKQEAIDNRLEIEGKSQKLQSNVEHFSQNHLSFLQSSEANRWINDVYQTTEDSLKHSKVSTLIDTGKLVHEVLASIRTLSDAPEALLRLEANHSIKVSSEAQREKVHQIVTSCLQEPQARVWFDGTWQLYNECTLVEDTPTGLVMLRPDRVMISADGSHIIVVDFKTGQPQKKYYEQVRQYMHLMKRMYDQRHKAQGYNVPNVLIEGYLWYIGEDYRCVEAVTL